MGTPKQLLQFRGKTLLRHAAETALATPFRPVIVVLGANADLLRPELDGLEVHITLNPNWQQGMSSSLQVGLLALQEDRKVSIQGGSGQSSIVKRQTSILMLCDQPFVTPELLTQMVATERETGKPIVACEYGGSVGVPALFDRSLVPELLGLQGAAGAKQIFARHPGEIAAIPFPQGTLDVDTPDDYARVTSPASQGA